MHSLRHWINIVETDLPAQEPNPFRSSLLQEPVFHGSTKTFMAFEHGHKNGFTNPRRGFYFTDDQEAAKEFGSVRPFWIDIRNPANFINKTEQEMQPVIDAALHRNPEYGAHLSTWFEATYGGPVRSFGLQNSGQLQSEEFVLALQMLGFDSLMFEDNFAGHQFDSFVVFEPSQIAPARISSN